MKIKKSKRNRIIFLTSAAAVMAFYVSVSAMQSKITTQDAKIVNFSNDVCSKGFAVRDEEIIDFSEGENEKNMVFNFSNGEKAPKGSVIANVYGSESEAKTAYEFENLKKTIEEIESKPFSYAGTGAKFLNQKVSLAIIKLSSARNFKEKQKANLELWDSLNKKEIGLGKKDSTENIIKNLKAAQSSLSVPQALRSVISPECGLFINNIDGFETSIPYGEIPENFDPENIVSESSERKVLGKIIKNDTWYVLLRISKDDAEKIKKGLEFNLTVEGKDNAKNIPCEVKTLNCSNNDENCTLMLSCNYINEDLAAIRKENFRISTGNYYGIKIPIEALHKENSDLGVFVKRAGYLKFKKIDMDFSGPDFLIAKYGPDYYDDENYIQPGDKIVIKGKKLYDGKKVK